MLARLTSSPGSPKALQRMQNCVAFIWPSVNSTQVQHKSTQLNAIDCFTNELVKKKTKKWDKLCKSLMKNKEVNNEAASENISTKTTSFSGNMGLISKGVISDIKSLRSPQMGLDIRLLSQAQLDNLLLSTLEVKNKIDFLYLVRQCILWRLLPSNEVLISCLKYLSTYCHLQPIEDFDEICLSQGHPLSKIFANFAAFKAIAIWRSGGANVALNTLQRGYSDSSQSEEGRKMIRNAFRTITEETLAQKSEAVLVSLMEVARSIYDDHKDIFVIACIWKQCFISDWFCDQKTAMDLFENYTELQQLVTRRSSSLCSTFLRTHQVDAVHRLIEVFLQYKQREACSNCLSLLFNYQYIRKDLRACAEVVKSCSELEMPLSEMQNERFLSLFLDHTEPRMRPTTQEARKVKPFKEYQYKF